MAKKNANVDIIDYTNDNLQLLKQLTKRNEQYIFELDKALVAANVTAIERENVKHTMMLELIDAQKKGVTARQLYGTVSQQVKAILEGPKEDLSQPSPDWQLLIDGGLILGSLFMIISGFNATQPQGIVSLVLNYIFAGFAMLMITKSSPRYLGQVTFKNKRSILKYVVFTALGMLTWMGGMVAVSYIPSSINPVLPSMYYIVIGAITFALRFYLKKIWRIRGTLF